MQSSHARAGGLGDLWGARGGPRPSCSRMVRCGLPKARGVSGRPPAAAGAAAHRACDGLWDAGAGGTRGRQDHCRLLGGKEGLQGGGNGCGKQALKGPAVCFLKNKKSPQNDLLF